jgi:glycosidase
MAPFHSSLLLTPTLKVLTDRFESGSGTPCSDLSSYCGGTWAGIAKQLDYIQGMAASFF